jgi:hypothetical protein
MYSVQRGLRKILLICASWTEDVLDQLHAEIYERLELGQLGLHLQN